MSTNEILGRVLGLEYAAARGTEAGIAFVAGKMKDNGVEKIEIAYMAAYIGIAFIIYWSIYHINGHGAANLSLSSKTFLKEETTALNDTKFNPKFDVDVQL